MSDNQDGARVAPFFTEHHKPDTDDGDWHVVRVDPGQDDAARERDVKLRIRKTPDYVIHRIEKKHGEETLRADSFQRAAFVRYTTQAAFLEARMENACYALIDSKNFIVGVGDDAAAEFYSRHLGREVSVGDDICLDGHWNDAIKRQLFRTQESFMVWVIQRSESMDAKLAKEAQLRGN